MHMGLFYAGEQKNNNYTVRRNLEGVHGQRVLGGRRALASVVEHGHG
jgi:hypothetical protein